MGAHRVGIAVKEARADATHGPDGAAVMEWAPKHWIGPAVNERLGSSGIAYSGRAVLEGRG